MTRRKLWPLNKRMAKLAAIGFLAISFQDFVLYPIFLYFGDSMSCYTGQALNFTIPIFAEAVLIVRSWKLYFHQRCTGEQLRAFQQIHLSRMSIFANRSSTMYALNGKAALTSRDTGRECCGSTTWFIDNRRKYDKTRFMGALLLCLMLPPTITLVTLGVFSSTTHLVLASPLCPAFVTHPVQITLQALYGIAILVFSIMLWNFEDTMWIKQELLLLAISNPVFQVLMISFGPSGELARALISGVWILYVFAVSIIVPLVLSLRRGVRASKKPSVRMQRLEMQQSSSHIVTRELVEMLSHSKGFDRAFEKFLMKEFSVENLYFWRETYGFRKWASPHSEGFTCSGRLEKPGKKEFDRELETDSEESGKHDSVAEDSTASMEEQPSSGRILAKARGIFEKYISTSAPLMVNLNSHCSKALTAFFETHTEAGSEASASLPFIFDDALEEITDLMERDSYRRFVKLVDQDLVEVWHTEAKQRLERGHL